MTTSYPINLNLLHADIKQPVKILRVQAKEMGDDNICVNAVAPGMIATEGTMAHSTEEAFNRVANNRHLCRGADAHRLN